MQASRPAAALLVAALTAAAPSRAFAQGSTAPDARALAAVVAGHAAQQSSDRRAIRQALARPEVREVADRVGVDVHRLSATIETLDEGDLALAAARARQVDARLDAPASEHNGSHVTTSTAAVIIALLIAFVFISATR